MKKTFTSIPLTILLLLCIGISGAMAQNGSVGGKVIDEKSVPVSYATVLLKGTAYGANTDDDGTFEISNVPPGNYTIDVSYVGYATFEQAVTVSSGRTSVDIVLKTDYLSLNEVVVVGYGTKQVKDMTGSVTSVSSKDFNKGSVASPEQLITGKVAGIAVTSSGGAPGASSRIRVRGGSSLNASNDPLIVIDGVPVDNNGVSGSANALNLINPNDIENITVLKDASAAAIYGSRAANGVIIITTKKGVGNPKLGVEYTANTSLSAINKYVPSVTADDLRALIADVGNSKQKSLVGTESTDWQDLIYRSPVSMDQNISFTGGIKNLPYRLTFGYLNDQGILKRSELERTSIGLNLSPSFLDDHLKIELNSKFAYTYNFFTDQGAIGSAVTFDPTAPVYADNVYGGYFEWLDVAGKPNTLAPKNPLGLIYQKDDKSNVYRFIGNVKFDYKMHFLPDLKASLNLGTDLSRSNGTVYIPPQAASNFTRKGVDNKYDQMKNNKLLEFYLNYTKDLESIHSKIDVTAGYSYQDWLRASPIEPYVDANGDEFGYPDINALGDTISAGGIPFKTQNTLISFYGRLNYTFFDRYLLTATLRDDGSSRFGPDNRWGLFPSVAFAWRISDESFLRDWEALSNLKLRLGYGVTGQQDLPSTLSDYPYIANYQPGESTAQYQFGNEFYPVLRPDGYDANIKWEETVTYNVGLDFGFINGRISGSIDVYQKNTSDLLAVIPVAAGTNFTNNILTNVGSLENKGIEGTLNLVIFDTPDFTWEFGGNVTYNHNEITKLTKVQGQDDEGILVGNISGGVGNTIQIHTVGYATNTFYVYQQNYDETGQPIEGDFADLNDDGIITPDDRYRYENPEPDVFAGMYMNFIYKNWAAGFGMRGSFGNYMYNNVNSQYANFTNIDGSKNYLNNLTYDYFNTEFVKPQYLSDYYVTDASFIRMDNFNIGYNFRDIINGKTSLKVTAIVQNVFVISDYEGLDPEIAGGIDNNIYPRPRIFSINLSLNL